MNSTTASQASEQDALFGAAVRARRAQLGITLDQLAQASGVSPGALSRVERGLLATSLQPTRGELDLLQHRTVCCPPAFLQQSHGVSKQ